MYFIENNYATFLLLKYMLDVNITISIRNRITRLVVCCLYEWALNKYIGLQTNFSSQTPKQRRRCDANLQSHLAKALKTSPSFQSLISCSIRKRTSRKSFFKQKLKGIGKKGLEKQKSECRWKKKERVWEKWPSVSAPAIHTILLLTGNFIRTKHGAFYFR